MGICSNAPISPLPKHNNNHHQAFVVSEFLNIKRIMNNSATTNPYKSFKVLTCNNIS
jgi:hypothetical protein